MDLSLLDNALWALGFIANVALLVVLIFRGRWHNFPVFICVVGFEVIQTICLFEAYRYGSRGVYAGIYWTGAFIDFALQLFLIFEIARIVLKPTGTWSRDARNLFLIWGGAGGLIAAVLAYVVHPSRSSSLGAWETRGNLFTALLICELFLAMMFASQRLGLIWRNHVMGLAQGLVAWALVCISVDTVHSYLGGAYDAKLQQVPLFVYLAAQVYWIVTFWLPEPARRPLSPEMQQYLVALHEKVAYDLTRVRNASGSR